MYTSMGIPSGESPCHPMVGSLPRVPQIIPFVFGIWNETSVFKNSPTLIVLPPSPSLLTVKVLRLDAMTTGCKCIR